MTNDITVRTPTDADAPALATLVAQLGYPAPAEVIPARLKNLSKASDSIVLVAEDQKGIVVALMTARVFPVIHHDAPLAWLTALVVVDSARGKGTGSMLLHRAETHAYYDNRGYERSGLRFTKKLGAD